MEQGDIRKSAMPDKKYANGVRKVQIEVYKVEDNVKIEKYRNELVDLVQKEKIAWRQRSKCLWLKKGDRNNKFFHIVASSRRRKTMDEDNKWYEHEEDIVRVFLNILRQFIHPHSLLA